MSVTYYGKLTMGVTYYGESTMGGRVSATYHGLSTMGDGRARHTMVN